MAGVDLQRYGGFLGAVVNLALIVVPIRPARLRGSVHRFGNIITLTVSLERYGGRHSANTSPQWQKSGDATQPECTPCLVKNLAYHVYLQLARSSVFSSADAFRVYTRALRLQLQYGDIEQARGGDSRCERYREVETLYCEAIELEPDNPAAWYNLGVLNYYEYERDHNRKAEAAFRRALSTAEGRLAAQVHSGLANVFTQDHHRFGMRDPSVLQRALYHGTEALSIEHELDVALKSMAFAYHQLSEAKTSGDETRSHREMAIEYYRAAIRINPRYYVAHNNLGNLYLELAKRSERDPRSRIELLNLAVGRCKRSIQLRPTYAHAYDNVGNAYYLLGLLGEEYLFDHAERYFRRAFSIKDDYREAKHDLSLLYLEPRWAKKWEYKRALTLHCEVVEQFSLGDTTRSAFAQDFAERLSAMRGRVDRLETRVEDLSLPDDTRQALVAAPTSGKPTTVVVANRAQGLAYTALARRRRPSRLRRRELDVDFAARHLHRQPWQRLRRTLRAASRRRGASRNG